MTASTTESTLFPLTTMQRWDKHATHELAVYWLWEELSEEKKAALERECEERNVLIRYLGTSAPFGEDVAFFAKGHTEHNGCWNIMRDIFKKLEIGWTLCNMINCEVCKANEKDHDDIPT